MKTMKAMKAMKAMRKAPKKAMKAMKAQNPFETPKKAKKDKDSDLEPFEGSDSKYWRLIDEGVAKYNRENPNKPFQSLPKKNRGFLRQAISDEISGDQQKCAESANRQLETGTWNLKDQQK